MAALPLVSVIIPTFNRLARLQTGLASLRRQSFRDFETIVVNDCSQDGTRSFLDGQPDVRAIHLPAQAGVAGARNVGIGAAKGEILVFVDDDCTLPADWLETLLAPYADPQVSGVGGKVIAVPSQEISFDHGGVDRFGTVKTIHAGAGFHPYLAGCHMSFRKKILVEAGLFDPAFFYGYDESDLCLRLARAGHTLVFNENAWVYHEVLFAGKYPPNRYYWGARSRRRFVWKNFAPGFLPLLGFEVGNLGYNLYRFVAGLLGLRRRITLFELGPALQGALAGHVAGLRILAARLQGFEAI